MRSLVTILVVAVVLGGCKEVLGALGLTVVDIPRDTYSVAEGRTLQIPVDVTGCDGPPETCVTWSSDNECVLRLDAGSTGLAVHFGTAVVHVYGDNVSLGDSATVTVTQQAPARIDLADRLLPFTPGLTGILAVKLFDASDYQLHRTPTFTSGDTTVVVVQGVDPGCGNLWPDGVQIRGVGKGSTFVFARFDTLVDSTSVTVQ